MPPCRLVVCSGQERDLDAVAIAIHSVTNDDNDDNDDKDRATSDMDEDEDSSEPDLLGLNQTDGVDGDLEPATATSKKRKKKKKSKASVAEPPRKQVATSAFAQRLLASRTSSAFNRRQEPQQDATVAAIPAAASRGVDVVSEPAKETSVFEPSPVEPSPAPVAMDAGSEVLTTEERQRLHNDRRRARQLATNTSLVDTSTGDEGAEN
jgi:hypothetical protein